MELVNRLFKLKERGTTVNTEIFAGLTTFVTMAYILAVNPSILEAAGMDKGAIFTATAISAAIATLCMAFMANLPVALASGMGLNAFFAYTVAPQYGWQIALIAVFIEGIIFVLISFLNVREKIFEAIPKNLRYAVSVGIGLFICLVGLINSGVVVANPATAVGLGDLHSVTVILTLVGLILTGVLCALKVKGGILIGILATYVIGIICELTGVYVPDPAAGLYSLIPTDSAGNFALISLPSGLGEFTIFGAFQTADFTSLEVFNFIIVIFAFLFTDTFDTVGTLIAVTEKAKMTDENGKFPKVKQALLSDAIGTIVGAGLGTSTVTSYVESTAGVSAGGKTGLTAFTVAILFVLALILSPVFCAIPSFATAPALIIVGLYMVEAITKINFTDISEGIPAFLCITMMPFAYSISEGLVFGVLSYVLIKLFTGKFKDVNIAMYIIAILFVLKIIFA